jgi:type I restriction enzyme S subunit
MFSATEGMPLIRIRDLRQGTSTEIRYTGDYDDRFVVKAGDFLIGMDGEFRCYEWKGADGLLNQRVCRLIDFGDVVDPEFVRWGIDTHLKIIEENTPYVTVRHLSAKKVKAIQFSFPSLGEQRRIVARIKECMERVEEIDTLRCDSRKQASAILPAGRFDAMKGDTPTVALGDIIQGGPTNGLYKPAKYYGSGTPILRIDNFDAGQVLTEPLGLRRLEVDESELHRYALQPGSIVLNRVNGSLDVVGKACLIDSLTEATLFESNMMAFSVDGTRADPVYVLHFLASPACRDQIKSKAKVIQ